MFNKIAQISKAAVQECTNKASLHFIFLISHLEHFWLKNPLDEK
jgi:hypothetical protein